MNAIIETAPTATDSLTLTLGQREVLRATRRGGRLVPFRAGGVSPVNEQGLPVLPRFPRRTVNVLVRNGLLARTPKGWELTAAGHGLVGEG